MRTVPFDLYEFAMDYEAIDRVILPAANPIRGIASFKRLGFRGIQAPHYYDLAGDPCVFFGGDHRLFHLVVSAGESNHPFGKAIHRAVEEGRGLCGVVLRVKDLHAIVADLRHRGIPCDIRETAFGDWATLQVEDEAGVPLALCQYEVSVEAQNAEIEMDDGFNHTFPVRRLDHLAAVARNLDAQTHFWTNMLRVPLFGEVVTPKMIIRQFRIGDAIIELLGAASADSPIHHRTPGLISMMAMEVEDIASAVAQARVTGFSIPDPATGVLPGTITATIPATDMNGLALQLLQYVS